MPCACAAASASHLTADLGDLFRWESADVMDECLEVFALHELHRQEDLSALLADIEHAADSGMRDPSRKPRFVEEERPPSRAR